jgi:butyrate kinase
MSSNAILCAMIVYVLNPGSTSTKLGLATVTANNKGVTAVVEKLELQHPTLKARASDHGAAALSLDGTASDAPVGLDSDAMDAIRAFIKQSSTEWAKPDAISCRAGLLGPCAAGTYRVTKQLAQYSLLHKNGIHASNYGARLALEWAEMFGVPAYLVDPPTVDELLPEARVTGVPYLSRRSRFHALNARAVARRAASEIGKRFEDSTIVVAHLGGGSSVTSFQNGRAIDTTGALLDEGPFSSERAGTLPIEGLLDLAYSLPRDILEFQLRRQSGFQGMLGTSDLKVIESRAVQDQPTREAINAYLHQVAKNVGAYAAASPGRPDAIVLTGGAARWTSLMQRLETRLGWIAPVVVIPGELEMEALAEGAGRVLYNLEAALDFQIPI